MTPVDLIAQAYAMINFLHPSPRGDRLIEISTRRLAGERQHWHSQWFQLATVAAEYAFEQTLLGKDVYVGVNPRLRMRSGRGGWTEDIAAVTALSLDFDRRHAQDPGPAVALLSEGGIPPSLVNVSGDGEHLHLRLAEELPVDVGHALAKRLVLACGGDPVHDSRRVMRVPGTFNHRRQAWCLIRELHPERVYLAAQIVARLDAARVPAVETDSPVQPPEPVNAPPDIEALFARLSRATIQAICTAEGPIIDAVTKRTDGGDQSFSAVDYRIISRLIREADATDGQIEFIFRQYPIRTLSAGRKSPRYIPHSIERVRRDLGRRASVKVPIAVTAEKANRPRPLVEFAQLPDRCWVIPRIDLDALDRAVFGAMPPVPEEFIFGGDGNRGVQ